MKRAAWVALGVLAVVGFIAAVGIAAASSVAPSLARGPNHSHAIGWAGICLGITFLCGATRAAWSGVMDLDNPHTRGPAVRFTADQDPAIFFGYLVFFCLFGIGAIAFGVYRLLGP